MKRHLITPLVVLLFLMIVNPLLAQSFTIKPYFGYLRPQMTDVNRRIENQIGTWRELLEAPLPSPGKISGRTIFGGAIQYHLNDDYFLCLDLSRYQKEAAIEYFNTATPPARFFFAREVKTVDAALHLDYYFDYDESGLLNKYIGLGVGIVSVQALSTTQSSFESNASKITLPRVDTSGDFSGTAFTLAISGGLEVRLTGAFSLWSEVGYKYAKVGQLDGSIRQINDQQNAAFTTSTSFDLSGFYVQGGLGIGLPF
jgi:opacity protein-like surface antigen